MKPKIKTNNKSFGILFFIIFLLIGLWPLLNGEELRIIYLIIGFVILFLGIINAKILTPFNKIWIKLGEILGIIIAPIVMALVYFVILTPISIIIRVFGKDLLGLKFLKEKNTYWIKRKKILGSMKKQF